MYLFIRNHIIVNNLRQLSLKHLKGLNTICGISHLNANHLNYEKCNQNHKKCLQNSFESNVRQSLRTFKTSNYHLKEIENTSSFDLLDGLIYKIRRYFGYSSLSRSMLQNTSVYVYESCSDAIDINKFFTHLNLADTFLSWFLVTQIHVWMCMTRAMSEGKEGRVMRNELVARMWEDCETRLKKLKQLPPKVQRQGLEDLLQQFQAAIFAYDEGFLTDDKTMAAALWRTLFMYENVDPQTIETMVSYIRAQLDHLQTVGTEAFFLDGKIKWKDFPPLHP